VADPSGFLALRDRAYAFLAQWEPATEEELLRHVYGGQTPAAVRAQLLAPLLSDPRLRQRPDGTWTTAGRRVVTPQTLQVVALAVAATGPTPSRHRVVQLAAHHVETGVRFQATVNPGGRVPGYVLERTRLDVETLADMPTFSEVLDELLAFLDERAVCAQEAQATWAYVVGDARRCGRTLAEPALIDFNDLAERVLDVPGKPTLSLVAEQLGVGVVQMGRPDDEARAIAACVPALLRVARDAELTTPYVPQGRGPLRRGATARAQPDAPGVYLFRDARAEVVYVGKARRLRSRLQAYVHRPLGPTRRMEGLADRVLMVDTTVCGNDLEALILEDREIRRLRPRYNTQRRQQAPRVWLRLPPPSPARTAKRQPALPRLLLGHGPHDGPGEVIGPFRNQAAAAQARALGRAAFQLDNVRRSGNRVTYAERLAQAWQYMLGDATAREQAACAVRSELGAARARGDYTGMLRAERLLAAVLAYDPRALLLPADPRQARYAVVRPGPGALEVFVLDAAVLIGQAVLTPAEDLDAACARVLADTPEPRTQPDDRDVVLRWLGAQQPPARLVYLAEEPPAAHRALLEALRSLAEA
jgi:DNA polymerase-3 subunit epsilon